MSRWQILIPHKSRDESLIDVASHARLLEQDEDREVTRQIVLQAHIDGVAKTAGELLEHVGGLDPHERRALLDAARIAVGLEATDDVDARERRNAPLAVGPAPLTPTVEIRMRPDGTFYEAPIDADHWTIGPSGQPVNAKMQAAAASRQAAEERSIAARRHAAEQERQHDADALADHERAMREQLQRETPLGVPVP